MEKSFRIMPHMCKQQVDEVNDLVAAADDIGAAATSVARGMGYEQLIQARENFKFLLMKYENHYRIVDEV